MRQSFNGAVPSDPKECAVSVPYALIRYALNRAFSILSKSASVRAYSGDK